MADEMNIKTYLDNRLKYHAASRVAIQEGESLGKALNLDAHTVTTQKIWSSPLSGFPVNTASAKGTTDGIAGSMDLVTVFKNGATSSNWYSADSTGVSGVVWINAAYPNVRLFENVIMTPVKDSDQKATAGSANGQVVFQSYEVVEGATAPTYDAPLEGYQRIQDWVSPMAIFDSSNGKPVPGYTVRIMAKTAAASWVDSSSSNTQDLEKLRADWALANGTWEFIYSSGLATFAKNYTPKGEGVPVIRMSGFQYIGKYLDDEINSFIEDFSNYVSSLKDLENQL